MNEKIEEIRNILSEIEHNISEDKNEIACNYNSLELQDSKGHAN